MVLFEPFFRRARSRHGSERKDKWQQTRVFSSLRSIFRPIYRSIYRSIFRPIYRSIYLKPENRKTINVDEQ